MSGIAGVAGPFAVSAVASWLKTGVNASTSLAEIQDATAGTPVVLKTVAWFGLESVSIPVLLDWNGNSNVPGRAYRTITYTGPDQYGLVSGTVYEGVIDQVKRLGFTCLRISVCEDLTWPGATMWGALGTPSQGASPSVGIGGLLNPDMIDARNPPSFWNINFIPAIEILDKVIDYAGSIGLRVILTMLSLAPQSLALGNTGQATGGKWYTTNNPGDAGTGPTSGTIGQPGDPRNEQQWIDALVFYADRYKDATYIANHQAMTGLDLVNEPFTSTWDNDPATGWPAAAERAAAAVQAVNPNILVIVQGTFGPILYQGAEQYTGYAGNLTGVAARPVRPTVADRLVYCPHEYPDFTQTRFKVSNFPANLANWWDTIWGYIPQARGDAYQAPLWIGEWAADLRDPSTLSTAVPPGSPVSPQQEATQGRDYAQALSDYISATGISWDYFGLYPTPSTSTDVNVLSGLFEADRLTPDPNVTQALSNLLSGVQPPHTPSGAIGAFEIGVSPIGGPA